jgi:hypothetical protein
MMMKRYRGGVGGREKEKKEAIIIMRIKVCYNGDGA